MYDQICRNSSRWIYRGKNITTVVLQSHIRNQLRNDFYITRLYAKGQDRKPVVFQKPFAWHAIDGGETVPGTLESILDMLPTPIQIEQYGIILIVVDYESWKNMVRDKQ